VETAVRKRTLLLWLHQSLLDLLGLLLIIGERFSKNQSFQFDPKSTHLKLYINNMKKNKKTIFI
jgi:hypothetical protein